LFQPIYYANGENIGYTREIVEDQFGLLWISGWNGLHLYDGTNIQTFNEKTGHPFSSINNIAERSDGMIVLQSRNGQNLLFWDPVSKRVTGEITLSEDAVNLAKNRGSELQLYDFLIDEHDDIWVVSHSFRESNTYFLLRSKDEGPLQIVDEIPPPFYPQILIQGQRIYATSSNAIYSYDLQGGGKKIHPLDFAENTRIYGMDTDDEGRLWIKGECFQADQTLDCSVYFKDKDADHFEPYAFPAGMDLENTDQIKFRGDEMWLIGTNANLIKYNLKTRRSISYSQALRDVLDVSPQYGLHLFFSDTGIMWLTMSKGMVKIQPVAEEIASILMYETNPICNGICRTRGIAMGSDSLLYVSTADKLLVFDEGEKIPRELGRLKLATYKAGKSLSPFFEPGLSNITAVGDRIFWNQRIYNISTGQWEDDLPINAPNWIGHSYDAHNRRLFLAPHVVADTALFYYDLDRRKLQVVPLAVELDETDFVTDVYFDPVRQNTWINITGKGTFQYDKDFRLLQKLDYAQAIGEPGNTGNNVLYGEGNDLWIGLNAGLIHLDLSDGSMQFFEIYADNLMNQSLRNIVRSIVPLSDSLLLLGTDSGILSFHTSTRRIRSFPKVPQIADVFCKRKAALKTPNGILYYATEGGLIRLNTAALFSETNKRPARDIVITKVTLYNSSLNKLMEVPYDNSGRLDLSYHDELLMMNFVWPVYDNEGDILYSHKIEGLDNDWSPPSALNQLRYHNLKTGTYTLKIRAGLSLGDLVNQEKQIEISVGEAWYRSTAAIVVFVCLVAGVFYFFYQFSLKKRMQSLERKKKEELNELRSRLYTNITHEFRTPLTVIMGMNDNVEGNEHEKELIKRNADNLLRLINQLLDLSKLDSGNLQLQEVQGNIVGYLQYLVESFYSMASDKKVSLTFKPEISSLIMDFDEGKIQHVIYNLLSNSIKFTRPGGKVLLEVGQLNREKESFLNITVRDTGIGISPEDLPHIFDRFFQSKAGNSTHVSGTGIGLALTRELVNLMGGTITVKSEVDWGSEFRVLLPVKKEGRIPEIQTRPHAGYSQSRVETAFDSIPAPPDQMNGDKPQVLIVEDNTGVVAYLQSILKKHYYVYVAGNGQEGIDLAQEYVPDLIITDVMMPEKNGFEVCEALKKDERTSHIPIVMLTAKSDVASKIEGLETGADAYLAKPFEKDELLVRLRKLLELRQVLQAKYGGAEAFDRLPADPEQKDPSGPTLEDRFLQKLQAAVEERMEDASLSIPEICQSMLMSHTQLYRKLKALTGKTPSQFIRSVRLQKARNLLQTTDLNISQIAYDVGFSDPNYFTRMFKQEFGIVPGEVRDK
jgi:signal transduction histidine kinase/DNA-binding response OmpR family regulator/ligand-binding sensor domain-containing protein